MPRIFIIDDEFHADWLDGEYVSFEAALSELRRLATVPWDAEPNQAPCTSWRTCGREYDIVEYEVESSSEAKSWSEVHRTAVLAVSKDGVVWQPGYKPEGDA